MRIRFYPLILLLFLSSASAQNISGKWYGKITQLPGAYSETYDMELNLNQRKNSISGDSYTTVPDSMYLKIGLVGFLVGESIRLSESLNLVTQEIMPVGWLMCVKNMHLARRQVGNIEFLEGTWDGKGRDLEACLPGRIFLTRKKEDLEKYIAPVYAAEPAVEKADSIDFSAPFLNTEAKKVTEIIVNHRQLQLELVDYMKVDNDTVSIYLNRKPLANDIWISRKPKRISFQLTSLVDVHELLLYANNLGEVPPNTSKLVIIDGKKTHRIMIESDKQKTAAVYLRYMPD